MRRLLVRVLLLVSASCATETGDRHGANTAAGAGAGASTAQPAAGTAGSGVGVSGSNSASAGSSGRAGTVASPLDAGDAAASGSGSTNAGAPSVDDAGARTDSGASSAQDAGVPPDAGTQEPERAPFKGVANSPCAVRSALGVSWYYNWEQGEKEPCSDGRGGSFVPMIWGHTGNEQMAARITSSVASFVSKGYSHVLGFNEPDNPSQSNIPVATAITLWPAFDNAAIKVVSPGTAANANPGQAWFTDFMSKLNADPALRADALALHWYGWNAGSCDAKAAQLESYLKWAERFAGDRPLWLTEWGCLNQSAPDEQTVVKFYQGALEVFARHPRLERYAWYPWATNCHLANDDGSLTALGKVYAAAPAYQ